MRTVSGARKSAVDRARRPRSISELRREELISATIEVIGEEGYEGATVIKIAKRAGLSAGLVHHYFASKRELLLDLFRYGNKRLSHRVAEGMVNAQTVGDKLAALVHAEFNVRHFTIGVTRFFIGTCATAQTDPEFLSIQKVLIRRMRSNLVHLLRAKLSSETAEEVALGLGALIDGLWLRHSINAEPNFRQRAIEVCIQYLMARAPECGPYGSTDANPAPSLPRQASEKP